MKSISLYVERGSLPHRIDPISKIYYVLLVILIPILFPTLTVSSVVMGVSILFLLVGRVFRNTLPIFAFVSLILVTVFVIQTLFYPGNQTYLYQIGGITLYREGFFFSLTIIVRVITVVSAFMLFVFTTKPADLVDALVRKGLSPRFGYVIASVFQIIPEMMSAMQRISDAQRSRGMETEGNLLIRMKAFLPLIGPVVLSSLLNVKERSLALEVRGFNARGKRSFLREEGEFLHPSLVQTSLLLMMISLIGFRILLIFL